MCIRDRHSASLSINKLRQYWVRKLDTYHNGLNGEIDSTQFNQTTERSSFSQMNQTQCTIISQLDSGSFTTHAQLHRKPASSSTQQIVELHNKQTEQHDDNNNQLIVKRFLEGLVTWNSWKLLTFCCYKNLSILSSILLQGRIWEIYVGTQNRVRKINFRGRFHVAEGVPHFRRKANQ